MATATHDVVITGVGVVSPIGIGRDRFWAALTEGRSGVKPIRAFAEAGLPVCIGAEVEQFDPKEYVRPRKSLKVMCRDAQLGMAAATLACQDAGLKAGCVDPLRYGIVLGADRISNTLADSEAMYRRCVVQQRFDFDRWGTEGLAVCPPLCFLKVLPNMIASHISIAQDAQGPNNTIHQTDVSALVALSEAARTVRYGRADVMIAGAASSQMNPFDCVRRCALGFLSSQQQDPEAAMRPFDASRNGQVWGEGAAVFILENERHATARGAQIMARVLGWSSTCETPSRRRGPRRSGLCRAIDASLQQAGLTARSLGHVNAHGASTIRDDRIEARSLHDVLPSVPVTAPKSYFGNLGAASGAVEMAASVLSLDAGLVPPTLNYERPDPQCAPLQVIHGEPVAASIPSALLVNRTSIGQAAAVLLAGAG